MSNTAATLDATWKEVYASGISNVVPKSRILLREIPFDESEKIGDKYVQPVALTQEHGVTYLGQRYGVDDLETAQAAIYGEAQVDGHGMLLRSQISYNVADKMAGSKQAFGQWSSLIVGNMMDSVTKRQELNMLYGQVGIGTIGVVAGSGGTRTWTLTAASWADGIWAGMENARIDVFQTAGAAARRNTNAVITITSVDFDNRQLVVAGNSTDLSAIVANDIIFFRNSNAGSSVYREAPGLQRIATNTGSLFNINAGTYRLWKGVESNSGAAALTLSKILGGVAAAAGRGLEEEIMVLVNPFTFRDMASDQAALKRHGGDSKTATNGYQYLQFYAQNGLMKIVPHIFCKGGDAFGIPVPAMKRVGATDTTYNLEGDGMGRVFLHIPDKAGFELRCRSEFSIYCEKPAQLIYWNNIVNS